VTSNATTFGLRWQAKRDTALADSRSQAFGSKAPSPLRSAGALQSAFTLIELILVMALLAIVLAVAAPSLSQFFKGRNLDSEAKRFMALTRHAQSRAVSEGVPMVLWLETEQRIYGLNADKSFVEEDPKAEQFSLEGSLQVEVLRFSGSMVAMQTNRFRNERLDAGNLYTLRFNPDGFVSLSSPEAIVFRQGETEELWVAQSRNRLNYEIYTGKPALARR
jgi:type II secretion system protein H